MPHADRSSCSLNLDRQRQVMHSIINTRRSERSAVKYPHLSSFGHLDSFGRSLVEPVKGVYLEPRIFDHPETQNYELVAIGKRAIGSLFRLFLFRSLQSDDQRDGQLKLFCSLYDSLGDHVATHDSSDYGIYQRDHQCDGRPRVDW